MRPPGQRLEPERIHLAVRDPQHIPRVLGNQHPGRRPRRPARFEHPAQLRDIRLHRRDRRRRRRIPPQQVEQPVHRHDMPGLYHQDRQQRALQPRAKIHLVAVPVHPERAQHGKVQPALAGHLGHRSPRII